MNQLNNRGSLSKCLFELWNINTENYQASTFSWKGKKVILVKKKKQKLKLIKCFPCTLRVENIRAQYDQGGQLEKPKIFFAKFKIFYCEL